MEQFLRPVVAGSVAVVGSGGSVTAVRLDDGGQVWSRQLGRHLDGIWRQDSIIVVLSDQVGPNALLWGLDLSSGRTRWRMPIGGGGLLGNQAQTSDGGLAVMRNGSVQVVNMLDGRLRWSAPSDDNTALTADQGLVITAESGALEGLDQHSGARRWQTPTFSGREEVTLMDGVLLARSGTQGRNSPTALVAIDPATGRQRWSFDVSSALTPLAAGPAGLALASYSPGQLYLLDADTGRQRWRVATFESTEATPFIAADDIVSVEGGDEQPQPTSALVDRSAADGTIRWQTALAPTSAAQGTIGATSTQLILTLGGGPSSTVQAFTRSSGQATWRVAIPFFASQSAVPAKSRYLAQSATPSQACALTENARPPTWR